MAIYRELQNIAPLKLVKSQQLDNGIVVLNYTAA